MGKVWHNYTIHMLPTICAHVSHTCEKMVCVSWSVATLCQLYFCMRANLALLDCTSEGMVRKKLGNISTVERDGEEAP